MDSLKRILMCLLVLASLDSLARANEPATEPSGVDVLLELMLPSLASDDVATRQEAQLRLEHLCLHAARPGAEDERLGFCQALLVRCGDATPLTPRLWLLRLVEKIGRAESVPTLAALLDDAEPRVREQARRALQVNPSDEATAALRARLARAADPEAQIAFIEALAPRCDQASLADLVRLTRAAEPSVAAAATVALGQCDVLPAIQSLRDLRRDLDGALRARATESLLRCAERLLQRGDAPGALPLYREIYDSAQNDAERNAGLAGLARAGANDAWPLLLAVLDGPDARAAGDAARFTTYLTGVDATRQMARACRSLSTPGAIRLLGALAERGDVAACPVVMELAAGGDAEVRVAALGALAVLGDSDAVLVTARAAREPGPLAPRVARRWCGCVGVTSMKRCCICWMTRTTPTCTRN